MELFCRRPSLDRRRGLFHTIWMALTIDDWIERDAICVAANSADSFNSAVDRVMASVGSVELLGL